MSTRKWIKVIVTVAAIAGATVFWMAQNRAADQLRAEKAALQRELDRLTQVEAANQQLSNLVAHADGSSANQQLLELLRLRNEVGMLRQRTNELRQALVRGERLRTPIKAGDELPGSSSTNAMSMAPLAVYPKASWAFAGYATPEDAFQSLNWAALNGDLATLRSNLTLEGQQEFAKQFENKSDAEVTEQIRQRFKEKAEARIVAKNSISDNFVVLEVSEAESGSSPDKLIFQKINGEWKLASDH